MSKILEILRLLMRFTAFKLSAGIISGIILTLLFLRLWSSVGAKYVYLGLGGILLSVLIIVLIYLLWKNLQVSRSKKMEGALGESVKLKKQRQQQLKTAISSLKEKWQSAMATLKSANIKIYDVPWVLLMGEPQSGKTTTLKRSGLDFPIGRDALSGAGGTVNCDWWFTNDAVVIDTAGRFTLPVESAPDKDEWHAFLKLLTKYRPKCPINSIIVTIPVTSILEDNTAQIEEKAGKIREKLLEVTHVLGIEYPVYIMISKSDLIKGFTEFCASLSSMENTQILGWNANVESAGFNPSEFDHQFETLVQRFYKWSLRRLRDLPVGDEADHIFTFPINFKNIKTKLELYLNHIFKADKYHTPLLHRGCFFSSGLQEGQAILNAIGENESGPTEFASSFSRSRPYFIYNFYRKVFLENGLVRRIGNVTRRERNLKLFAIVFACCFSIASVWYLWTGYTSLTRVLKPTKTRIETAMKVLVSGKGAYPTNTASEIVRLTEIIEQDRIRLSGEGVSYRFLKGKNNSLVTDMKNIEDALLLRGLFQPLMSIAARDLNKHPEQYADKLRLFDNTVLDLGILVKSPRSLYSFESDIIFSENKDPWLDIDTALLIELAKGYPRGTGAYISHRFPERSRVSVRQKLVGLNQFWKTYPEKTWSMLKSDLFETMTHYRSMVDASGGGVPVDASFQQKALVFKSSADKLIAYLDGITAVFPDHMVAACTKDYQVLSTLLEKGRADSEIINLQPTIDRHASVCNSSRDRIVSDLNNYPALFEFMVTKEGAIHPEFKKVHDIITSAIEFQPLFKEKHQQLVSQNPERITGFLDAWDAEWHEMRKGLEKELTAKLSLLTAPGWEKGKLAGAIGLYLKDVVWEADLDAAIACIEAVIKDNSLETTALTKEMILPNTARTKWLEEKFKLFAGINEWLVKKYPSRPDISRGTGLITGAMLEIYKDYLVFWNNALENYDPSKAILKTTSWKRFRQIVLEKRGLFLDPGAWPFNLFLENITLKGIDSLKEILGEDRDKFIIRLEKKVARTAFVYSLASGNLGSLSSSQDRFYQCVDTLPDNPSDALTALNEGLMDDFKALGSFRRRIDSGLGGGEILAARPEKIQRHGLNILKKGFSSGFSKDQKALVNKWYPTFKRHYPFADKGEMIYSSKRRAKTITETYATVTAADFYDFCFDDELGVDGIEKKYGILAKIEKSPKQEKYAFLKNCIQWRNFCFDAKEKPKQHAIKISMGKNNKKVSQKYTVVKIKGLDKEGGSNSLRLRFSGKSYKSAKGIWHINQDIPVEFTAINEETGKSANLILDDSAEGSFTFPAYLIENGKKQGSSKSRKWALTLYFPDPNSAKKRFHINLTIEWDEELPAHIVWAM